MAVNFVQQVANSFNSSVSTIDAPAFTPSAGSTLICLAGYLQGGGVSITLSDLTGSNGSWTATDTLFEPVNAIGTAAFCLPSAAATSSTIRATFTPTIAAIPSIYVAEFSGTDGNAALKHAAQLQINVGSSADSVSSGLSGALGSQPALVFGFTLGFPSAPSGALAAGTGYTGLTGVWDYGLGNGFYAKPEWHRVTSTTSLAATFSDSIDEDRESFLLAFAEAPVVVPAVARPQGAGGAKSKARRAVVEIDGKKIVVASAKEAIAVLRKARDQIKRETLVAIKAPIAKAAKVRDLEVPKVQVYGEDTDLVGELQAQVVRFEQEMARVFAQANQRLQQRLIGEQDDEDILLLL